MVSDQDRKIVEDMEKKLEKILDSTIAGNVGLVLSRKDAKTTHNLLRKLLGKSIIKYT